MLAGRTAGLRPAERRRLESLCHRRHPGDAVADLLTLQRLAAEGRNLELPLSLVVDRRGLCRLLWVGKLEQAARLLEKLPGPARRQGSDLRLLTCAGAGRQPQLHPSPQEAVVAMDLSLELWLRYGQQPDAGGRWPAAIHTPASSGESAWRCSLEGDLAELCAKDPAAVAEVRTPSAPAPPWPWRAPSGCSCWCRPAGTGP